MDTEIQIRMEHFWALKSKYQATKYTDSSPSSLLYLILRKVELGIEITKFDFDWLKQHELFETVEIIRQGEESRKNELIKLGIEFSHLKSKYKATQYCLSWKSTPLYSILGKLDSENQLNASDVNWLRNNGFVETVVLAENIELKTRQFAALKHKYQATKYSYSSSSSPLFQILQTLDATQGLSDSDINWLKEHELFETLAILQQQEEAREAEFAKLKAKYQATKHPDTSVSTPLYLILQKLDANKHLSESAIEWLKQHELTETITLIQEIEEKKHFAALKVKYKATQYEDSSRSSHLYKVLKRIESANQPCEQDINYLKKRKLTETIVLAQDKYASILKSKVESVNQLSESEIDWLKQNEREDVITFVQRKYFAILKFKYDVSDYKDNSPDSPLYAILQKLEKAERIESIDVAWLVEENKTAWHKLFSGKIFIAYHKIEATFYEQEYKCTGNKWNLPNASSHWRKADEPQRALKLTENLDFDKIKENKLKSALLTTRGGAFRDIEELNEAERCARQAIEYQPSSHHPYTLMGAICYERGDYCEGDRWFEEAIKRGASPRDQDAEIKRVVKNAKDENKRQKVVEYLLKKDPQQYAWAKSYLKKPTNKG